MSNKGRIYQGEKTVSSVNGFGKTGQTSKEWNWATLLHYIQILTQNRLKT